MGKIVKKERIAARIAGAAEAAEAAPPLDMTALLGATKPIVLDFGRPHDDPPYLALLHRFRQYLNVEGPRLGISTQELAVFEGTIVVFENVYRVVYDMPNHTEADEVTLAAARIVMDGHLDTLIDAKLRLNPNWRKADEVAVGFGEDTPYSRLPPATDHPDSRYINDQPGRLKGRFSAKNASRAGIPKGQLGVEIEIKFDNPDGTHTIFKAVYTTGTPTIILPVDCCNKNGMAKCRWWNRNPIKGVWSDAVPVYCLWKEELAD
ncbi:hypothetical protein AGMMS49942_22680 [Spirochaetia bacterium]|nr:hypothetical protein AGMMS49942_22680 [Spirochaetia bacterium]